MSRKVKRSRRLVPIWRAPFAPTRHGCAMTSGSDSEPTSTRPHSNRLRPTIEPKTPTTGARAALAANTRRHRLDRNPKNEPTSQPA